MAGRKKAAKTKTAEASPPLTPAAERFEQNPARNAGGYERLTPDLHNMNRGTERGLQLLEKSLRELGAGRSILVDKDGHVIAGNKTLERAAELGLQLQEVETDGRTLIVVRRTDLELDTPQGRALALADNRVAQVDLSWDPVVLAEMLTAGVAVDQFFFPDELKELGVQVPDFAPVPAATQSNIAGKTPVKCPSCGHEFVPA